MLKTIDNASQWHRLWSVRLAILSAILGAIELSLPMWHGVVPEYIFASLSTVTAAAAAVARVIRQEALHNDGT